MPASRPRISPAEGRVLAVTRAIVGTVPFRSLAANAKRAHPPPRGLRPAAMGLLQQTLARGSVHYLARQGGHPRGHYDLRGNLCRGRLWQRHRAPELRFTRFAWALITWLERSLVNARDHGNDASTPGPEGSPDPQALGDQLLVHLVCGHLAKAQLAGPLAGLRDCSRDLPLIWLSHPELAPPGDLREPIEAWLTSPGSIVFEALQPELARRTVARERAKAELRPLARLREAGHAERRVFDALLAAVRSRARLDLLDFCLEAAAKLLPEGRDPDTAAQSWFPAPADGERHHDRAEARQAATGFLEFVITLGELHEDLRHVGFVDEDYDDAQALLSRWASFGESGFARARQIHAALSRVDATASPPPTASPPTASPRTAS